MSSTASQVIRCRGTCNHFLKLINFGFVPKLLYIYFLFYESDRLNLKWWLLNFCSCCHMGTWKTTGDRTGGSGATSIYGGSVEDRLVTLMFTSEKPR